MNYQQKIDQRFKNAALKRAEKRAKFVPLPTDSEKELQIKVGVLLNKILPHWAEDRLAFLEHNAWALDPLGKYGYAKDLVGLAPKGMVPLLLFDKQKEFVKLWDEAVRGRDEVDLFIDKCRQQAITTTGCWNVLYDFLFTPSHTQVLTTYDTDYVDMGGKGHRDPDSMFGRIRSFLDSFLWGFGPCFGLDTSALKFNQNNAPPRPPKNAQKHWQQAIKWTKWTKNTNGFEDSQDTTMKMVRPPWFVFQKEIFAGASGNYIIGSRPGENLARSLTPTLVWTDELPAYNGALKKPNADELSFKATSANTRIRVGSGTPPVDGTGTSTYLYRRIYVEPPQKSKRTMSLDWWENPIWMAGGGWICMECGHINPLPPHPPPKTNDEHDCDQCSHHQRIVARGHRCENAGDLTSPRYETACDKTGDKVGISAEIDRDWTGSHGERLFAAWRPAVGVTTMPLPYNGAYLALEGFDPGQTIKNPGAWVMSMYDQHTHRIRIMGYWMAAVPFAEYWVPFMKRWNRSNVMRHRISTGKMAQKTWMEAFSYPEEALQVLDFCSKFPLGRVHGDKYGSHRNLADSGYDVLSRYGISVHYSYTTDREELVRHGIGWAAHMEIDSEIAEICPPSPVGGTFPCIKVVFEASKPRPYTGQGVYKLDVDKQAPLHVNHAADAWFYMCKALESDIHAGPDADGNWSMDPFEEGEVVVWGEGAG